MDRRQGAISRTKVQLSARGQRPGATGKG